MIAIVYPEPRFSLRQEAGHPWIRCLIRDKWLQLTNEEWVRQQFLNYLIQVMAYPATLIAVEKELVLNGLKKRFDILVYDPAYRPWLLVECKAPDVPLSETVLQQALRYNLQLPVPYIVLTNGKATLGWKKEGGGLRSLETLPAWQQRD